MSSTRRFGLVFFGAILVVAFAGIAIANGGVSQPSVPSGDVALVQDVPDGIGDISQADYNRTFMQTWKRGGLKAAPKTSDAQYQQIRDASINDLLDQAWLTGEANDLGISATEREVKNEFATIRKDQFPDDAAYNKFLKDSGFTEDEVLQRVKLQVLSRKIEDTITKSVTTVPDSKIEQYYEDNKATFATPESRDIRLVVTDNQADADKVAADLKADSSDKAFAKLAKQYSTHTSKDQGGKTVATEGIYPDPAGKEIMSSETDVVGGPVKAGSDFYVWKVNKINDASTQSLDDVREQISQQLLPTLQQKAMGDFVAEYNSKWTARTFCAEDYLVTRCHNYVGTGRLQSTDPSTGATVDAVDAACYESDAADKVGKGEQPLVCPSLVQGRKVPPPGTALELSTPPAELATVMAQRPVPVGDATAAPAAGALGGAVDPAAAAAAAAAGGDPSAAGGDPAAAAAAAQAQAAAAAQAAGGQ